MIKVETICKRAFASRDADTRRQAREIMNLYSDKYRSSNTRIVKDILSIDEYKKLLDNHGIEYVEACIEKENGKTLHWVIPTLIFKNMTQKDINILFKV